MRDRVIIKIELNERISERFEGFNILDTILATTEFAELGEAGETETRERGDA